MSVMPIFLMIDMKSVYKHVANNGDKHCLVKEGI